MSPPHPVPTWLAQLPRDASGGFGQLRQIDTMGARRSAVLMLFGPRAGGGEYVVLTERSARLRKHAGQVSFPGGSVDANDADAVDTALREAHEEIGLDRDQVQIVGQLPSLPLSVTGFRVAPVLSWWRAPGHIGVVDPGEVARVAEVSIADLVDPANRFTAIAPERRFAAPGFEVDGLFVWGFTAIVLAETLTLAGLSKPWDSSVEREVPERYRRR